MRARPFLVLLPLAAFVALPAQATTVGFGCITNNLAGDCAIGESQLSAEVSDQGGGVVRFLFVNAGPEASAISEVYFDDGSLLALSTVTDGPGVDFEPDANPPDLPGGNSISPAFQVTAGFLAQAIPAPSMNGVGPSEWVAIDFLLQGGKTFADVLTDLSTGDLRIGLHVIAYASGGSESFVNTPLPEPSTGLLLGAGFVVAMGARRRRSIR